MPDGTRASGLRAGHVNVYHLYNKLPDVSLLLSRANRPVHLFGISETRLDSRVTDTLIQIPNYSVLRRDGSEHGHTGLALYIHASIANLTVRRTDLETKNVECMWVEVKHSKSSALLVGYVYRNPAERQCWRDDFESMMDKVNACGSNILLLGDFNIDLNKPQLAWANTTSLFGLHQLVQDPTRVTSTSTTLIDHIYTNHASMVSRVSVSKESFSDHYPVFCTWSFKLPKRPPKGHTTIKYRSFKNFNQSEFLADLAVAPFRDVFGHSDPDGALEAFYNVFYLLLTSMHHSERKELSIPRFLPG